jgi:hypothetical protein
MVLVLSSKASKELSQVKRNRKNKKKAAVLCKSPMFTDGYVVQI